MKHESIVVVYDSCQAIAEEIADKLGAETISVQSVNTRHLENSQSFVLAIEFFNGQGTKAGHLGDCQLTPHWQYACQTFRGANLAGKTFAVFVALGNRQDHGAAAEAFCDELRKSGAHVVGELAYVSSPQWVTDNWVCIVSPSL